MNKAALFEGRPFDENARLQLTEAFPDGTVSFTRGRHYALEEDFLYLVRSGPRAVVMPRMAYGEEIAAALAERYGKENRIVGRTEISQTRSHHS